MSLKIRKLLCHGSFRDNRSWKYYRIMYELIFADCKYAKEFNLKIHSQKNPHPIMDKGFSIKLGTDLLSHLLRQYHWLWRA